MNTYGTSAICPCCGKTLYTSNIPGYSFVCKDCDKNFYTKEVKDTSADYFDEISESLKQLWEIDIPVKINDWEEKQLEWEKIAQKYNCDFLGYDIIHKRVEVGIGWENGFPEFDVLNQLIEEIEKQMKIIKRN